MKIGDRVFVRGFVDEIRKDVVIIRNEGGYFGTVESEIVPVIRCKDCRHYSKGTLEGKHLCLAIKFMFTPTTEDEWCSRAERREE